MRGVWKIPFFKGAGIYSKDGRCSCTLPIAMLVCDNIHLQKTDCKCTVIYDKTFYISHIHHIYKSGDLIFISAFADGIFSGTDHSQMNSTLICGSITPGN